VRVVFVGHTFAINDRPLVEQVKRTLRNAKFSVITGEPPEARSVAGKVRERIDSSDIFVALLTRRHRIAGGRWTTSPWVIEEKGYALGRNMHRPVIIMVEEGITVPDEIGGVGGDIGYISFDRHLFDRARAELRETLRRLP
jgi:hypothetical protein